MLITQSCLTFCDPMDCSSPGSSVNRIIQARILEWGHSLLQEIFPIQPWSPTLQADSLPSEPAGKPKTLILESIEGRRRKRWQRMRGLNSITDSMDMHLSKLRETVKDREAWHAAARGVTRRHTQLTNWTMTNTWLFCPLVCQFILFYFILFYLEKRFYH